MRPLLHASLAAAFAACAVQASDVIPAGYPAERYESLWKHNPFTLSSAATEPPPAASFVDQLVLAAVVCVGDRPAVTIYNKQTQKRTYLDINTPSEGIQLLSVQNETDPKNAVAFLKFGAETGQVRFDLALLKAAAQTAPVVQQPGQPAPVVVPQPGTNPPPTIETLRDRRRRLIIPSQPPPAVR